MNIKQDKKWLSEYILSLSPSNLAKIHHTLSEISSSIQIGNGGQIRIPYSYPTETGLQIIIDKIVFADEGYTWLSEYYSEDGNYYLDFDDDSKDKLRYLYGESGNRLKSQGLQNIYFQTANKIEINNITIDLNRCKLCHINGTEIDINPETQEIKLLIHLINRAETIIEWSDLIEMLGLDKELYDGRDVQMIKKKFIKLLKQVGMDDNEIEKMIRTVKKKGLGAHRSY